MSKFKKIYCFITALFVSVCILIGGQVKMSAYSNNVVKAEETDDITKRDPVKELQNSTINGKLFNLDDYPLDSGGNINSSCLLFYEHEFCEDLNFTNKVRFFIYVYNPSMHEYYDDDIPAGLYHNVTILFGNPSYNAPKVNSDGHTSFSEDANNFEMFKLQKCSESDNLGFVKFELIIPETGKFSKEWIRSKTGFTNRIYNIGNLNLYYKAFDSDSNIKYDVDNIACGTVFTYSGYMAGCYAGESLKFSSLECDTKLREVLSPDVNFTYYRPDGYAGNLDTQHTLKSVYFQVPNDIYYKYGNFVRASAQWHDATLKPYLLTGNKATYNLFSNYVGVNRNDVSNSDDINDDLDTLFLMATLYGDLQQNGFPNFDLLDREIYYSGNYSFGFNVGGLSLNDFNCSSPQYNTDIFYFVFPTDTFSEIYPDNFWNNFTGRTPFENKGDDDRSKNYVLPRKTILDAVQKSHELFDKNGETAIFDKYSSKIFIEEPKRAEDLILNKYNFSIYESDPEADSEGKNGYIRDFDLKSVTVNSKWWMKFLGLNSFEDNSESYQDIKVIEEVTTKDIENYSNPKDFCDEYKISTTDYSDFVKFVYDSKEQDCTTFLLRYQVSDYIATQCTLGMGTSINGAYGFLSLEDDCRMAVDTINLNFKVIDLSFEKDGVMTVIPVAMNPQDFIADGTPALDATKDLLSKELEWVIFLILLLIILIVIWPLASPVLSVTFNVLFSVSKTVFKFAWGVITFPFKLIKPNKRE